MRSITSSQKIRLSRILNWDSTVHPRKNVISIVKDRRRFKLVAKRKPKVIRIALHPKDLHDALQKQREMIVKLKDKSYIALTYSQLHLATLKGGAAASVHRNGCATVHRHL